LLEFGRVYGERDGGRGRCVRLQHRDGDAARGVLFDEHHEAAAVHRDVDANREQVLLRREL